MTECSDPGYGYDRKFLDETTELRKEPREEKFEYFEAMRNPETIPETIAKHEREIQKLQDSINEKAPRTAYRGFDGYGHCW